MLRIGVKTAAHKNSVTQVCVFFHINSSTLKNWIFKSFYDISCSVSKLHQVKVSLESKGASCFSTHPCDQTFSSFLSFFAKHSHSILSLSFTKSCQYYKWCPFFRFHISVVRLLEKERRKKKENEQKNCQKCNLFKWLPLFFSFSSFFLLSSFHIKFKQAWSLETPKKIQTNSSRKFVTFRPFLPFYWLKKLVFFFGCSEPFSMKYCKTRIFKNPGFLAFIPSLYWRNPTKRRNWLFILPSKRVKLLPL